MKRIAVSKMPAPLNTYVWNAEHEPVVLTANGRPVAAIVALPNTDSETVSLSTNPRFLAIIERSRRRQAREGGISPEAMRQRLGLGKRRARRSASKS